MKSLIEQLLEFINQVFLDFKVYALNVWFQVRDKALEVF